MKKNSQSKGTALITGGATRIGKIIALALASQGYNIALHYNSSILKAKQTAKLIESSNNSKCHTFACDLSKEKSTIHLIARVIKKCPNLNLLVNNASTFKKSNFKTAQLKNFNDDINLHLKAPFILTQEFAKVCKKGHVINMIDTNIVKNKTQHLTYLLSKKALLELTKLSAIELAPRIRVNGIAPGLILAPTGKGEGHLLARAKNVPLKKQGSPENIVQSVQFLIENTYLTGQIIFNDGGEHLT